MIKDIIRIICHKICQNKKIRLATALYHRFYTRGEKIFFSGGFDLDIKKIVKKT